MLQAMGVLHPLRDLRMGDRARVMDAEQRHNNNFAAGSENTRT
jgi:hypothetical protein